MKKNIIILLILVLSTSSCYSQIPIEKFRAEIEKLDTEKQISGYWNKLYKIDQEILLNTSDLRKADSISISNMIKTALIFDIHGTKGYNSNGWSAFLTIINLSHNQIGKSQIAYWPIIEKSKEIGGAVESFGGKYPAYQLESVSLTFYNYSVFNQEDKYLNLVKKMSGIKTEDIVNELSKSYEYQNNLRKLSEVAVLDTWNLQNHRDRIEKGEFSIVKMSDNGIYLKKYGRIQRLKLIKEHKTSRIYRIENEPFDWKYVYGEDGSLSLIDEKNKELIKYTLTK